MEVPLQRRTCDSLRKTWAASINHALQIHGLELHPKEALGGIWLHAVTIKTMFCATGNMI